MKKQEHNESQDLQNAADLINETVIAEQESGRLQREKNIRIAELEATIHNQSQLMVRITTDIGESRKAIEQAQEMIDEAEKELNNLK